MDQREKNRQLFEKQVKSLQGDKKQLNERSFAGFGGVSTLKPINNPSKYNQPVHEDNINEKMSSATIKRAQGLLDGKDVRNLKDGVNAIMQDLTGDGFAAIEAKEFIMLYVDNITKSYR